MKRKFLYWMVILLVTLGITIVVQLLFRTYRFQHLSELHQVGKIEFVFTTILLPIYLGVVYFFLGQKSKMLIDYSSYVVLVIVCIITSSYVDFSNWWETEGKIISVHNPEGRDVIELALVLQFLIAIVMGFLSLYTSRLFNNGRRSTTT
jgi:hypothetical protein